MFVLISDIQQVKGTNHGAGILAVVGKQLESIGAPHWVPRHSSLLALVDAAPMRAGFFGILKLLTFLGLSVGYGWFAYFQPPSVYDLGSTL